MKILVDVETAFEVGVREGRKEMIKHIKELFKVSTNLAVIERHLDLLSEDGIYKNEEIRRFFNEIKRGSDNGSA